MNNREFDSKIKELVDSTQIPVGEDLWGGIEQGIVRRNTIVWVRRIGVAAAVAASLVVGLILMPSVEERPSMMLAQEIQVEPARLDVDEITLSAMAKIEIMERPAAIMPQTDNSPEEAPVEQVVEVAKVAKVAEVISEPVASKPDVEVPEEVYDNSWIYVEEEMEESGQGVVIGLSSNMLAFNGNGNAPSRPQYMPGSAMNVQSGITPINKPTFGVPLTFGLQVQFPMGERFAIGTGLNYTYLQSSFQALIDNTSQAMVDQSIHYLGVPVSFYLNILKNNRFTCYASVGGAVEKGLLMSSRIKDIFDGIDYRKSAVSGIQWSANLGVGLQYSFTDFFGIYLDPSLVYFFDSKQPYSVRTAQPLQFEMELGLRFNL